MSKTAGQPIHHPKTRPSSYNECKGHYLYALTAYCRIIEVELQF